MHLVEVITASTVMAIASSQSLQIWSAAAGSSVRLEQQRQQLEQLEADRLALQQQWRLQGSGWQSTSPLPCLAWAARLQQIAAGVPVPAGVERQLSLSGAGQAVAVQWRSMARPTLQRQRLYTAAGLGLCTAELASGEPPAEAAAGTEGAQP